MSDCILHETIITIIDDVSGLDDEGRLHQVERETRTAWQMATLDIQTSPTKGQKSKKKKESINNYTYNTVQSK